MERKRARRTGFTLIELLIAITIIGILVAVGLGSFGSAQKKARDGKRKTDLESIARALELYYNDCGAYPSTNGTGGIVGCGNTDSCNTNADECTPGQPFIRNGITYMQELPTDPMGNYYYDWSAQGYVLYARLENTSDSAVPHSGSTALGYEDIWCRQGPHDECNYALVGPGSVTPTFTVTD